ncbi:MAG: Rpn family recombination-promoting nuclease/putative transposase [Treponema sp.]|jgi:predicted transposase/invertase (TIGR01784 family)|nr:Rpn family recombination-promoting nuclease/putative transposase [Treponema sp.]
MGNNLLSPLSDDVFKAIFADRRNIDNLAAFLRPVVNLPDDEYTRLTIVDLHLGRLFKKDKQGILDVKALTRTGKVINIEVQVCRFVAIRKRILYYLAKLIGEQLGRGDGYERIQQVIIVLICDHIIFDEPEPAEGGRIPSVRKSGRMGRYMNSFLLRNDTNRKIFTDLIKIITIELPKVPEMTDRKAVWPWARFFTCKGEEEFDMLTEEYPELTKVVGTLKKLSWGERRREIAFQKEMWRRDRAAMDAQVREEGKAEGRKEGEKDKAVAIARNLKAMGEPVEKIVRATGVSRDVIESL